MLKISSCENKIHFLDYLLKFFYWILYAFSTSMLEKISDLNSLDTLVEPFLKLHDKLNNRGLQAWSE